MKTGDAEGILRGRASEKSASDGGEDSLGTKQGDSFSARSSWHDHPAETRGPAEGRIREGCGIQQPSEFGWLFGGNPCIPEFLPSKQWSHRVETVERGLSPHRGDSSDHSGDRTNHVTDCTFCVFEHGSEASEPGHMDVTNMMSPFAASHPSFFSAPPWLSWSRKRRARCARLPIWTHHVHLTQAIRMLSWPRSRRSVGRGLVSKSVVEEFEQSMNNLNSEVRF